ncbi:MAG: cysteine desulfurase-like protein [Pirellulales bacterium]|nr:cysteine desulfurase-like protein [Pirellulales bacterium]
MTPPASPTAPLDVSAVRQQFPALAREVSGRQAVFFDGPAGSQVPQRVIDAIGDYLRNSNANHGGVFATSVASDALLDEVHRAAADLLHAPDPHAVCFGANMTTLCLALSRALAKTWEPGDEIIVTRLDHDANVTPWVLAARDAGVHVHHVPFRPEDCTLDLQALQNVLSTRTRLVAVGCASNAVGTVNSVREIARVVQGVGAEICLDAVHYVPHGLVDVQAWGCDYLLCSAYKFFGPHVGILWGRAERLAELPVYKVRPAPNDLPGRWMTGTQNHECLAGVLAAIEYLAALGRSIAPAAASRRQALVAAYEAITAYERGLQARLLAGLAELPSVKIYGITDPKRLHERVPTVSITHRRYRPLELAQRLADEGVFVWHGNYYALSLTEALGLEPEGMVRIGLLHYNTREEVERLLDLLRGMEA